MNLQDEWQSKVYTEENHMISSIHSTAEIERAMPVQNIDAGITSCFAILPTAGKPILEIYQEPSHGCGSLSHCGKETI